MKNRRDVRKSLKVVTRECSILSEVDQAFVRLCQAVVMQACRDATHGDPLDVYTARRWLTSSYCEDYCLLAGFPFQVIKRWAEDGCPTEKVVQPGDYPDLSIRGEKCLQYVVRK